MKKIVMLLILIANFAFTQDINGLTVYDDGSFNIRFDGKSYTMSADNLKLTVVGSETVEYAVDMKDKYDIKSYYEYGDDMWIVTDSKGVYFYQHNYLIASYFPIEEIAKDNDYTIKSIFSLSDGTLKIITGEIGYEISPDNQTMIVLDDIAIEYVLIEFEADIRDFCQDKNDIIIAEDETGIYFYYEGYLLSKYQRKYVRLASISSK